MKEAQTRRGSRKPASQDGDYRERSAQVDVLRVELERERLRADRAVAYGARLLMQLDSLEQLVREYAAHRPDCIEVEHPSGDRNCSCGLSVHLKSVETWRVQMGAS